MFDCQGAINMAADLIKEGRQPKAISCRLLNEAVRVRKCKDNCTVMVALIQQASG